MKTIDILIVVDVEGALAGALSENVYLIDTNKHLGSGNEGQAELITICADGQTVNWSVVPVSPSSDVEITGFTGVMIDTKVCLPKQVSANGVSYWQGLVEAQGVAGSRQYSVVMTMDGREATFDPFLVVQ
jgi:hypothetical protein